MKKDKYPEILRVVVGSQAHGLANKDSDYDFRGVFVQPTTELLSLFGKPRTTSWIEAQEDNTAWEIGHFLEMSVKSNPTILETYLAPKENSTVYGDELRELFPYIWSSEGVKNAFIGYGLNQRKKFLANKDNRRAKYAAAYLRVLFNAWELLQTGTFTIRIADLPIGETVKKYKSGDFTIGEVVDTCEQWQAKVEDAYEKCEKHEPDVEKINSFLLKVRKEFWDERA